MAQLGHVWRKLVVKTGNMAPHKPPSKPKNIKSIGYRGRNANFSMSHWIREIGPGWPTWAGLPATWAQLGPKLRYLVPNWSPLVMLSRWASNGSRVVHMEIQVAAMPPHFEDLKPHESQLKRSCPPQMGPSGGQVAPSWSRWAEVGAKWVQDGPELRLAGWSWPQVVQMLRSCRIETMHSKLIEPPSTNKHTKQSEP